jgi:hypothetical protein
MKTYEMKSEYYTIGFLRDDYDFEVMATLVNGVGLFGDNDFEILLENTLKFCQSVAEGEKVVALPRQDTPDLINLEDEELEKHFNIKEAI